MKRSKRMDIKPLIRASVPHSTAAQCQETHSPQLYISQVSRQENYDNIQTYKHIFNSAVTLKPWLMDPLCDIYSPSSLLHCFFVVGDKLTLALELLGGVMQSTYPAPSQPQRLKVNELLTLQSTQYIQKCKLASV